MLPEKERQILKYYFCTDLEEVASEFAHVFGGGVRVGNMLSVKVGK